MKILFIGDVVGPVGKEILKRDLPKLKDQFKPQLTVANGENASDGRGISPQDYRDFMDLGVDVVTLGNHSFDDRAIYSYFHQAKNLIRPANYPNSLDIPGSGYVVKQINQDKVAVINLHGRALMGDLDDPFRKVDQILEELADQKPIIFVDFHAETTSEKEAMAWYLDGRVAAVVGTHTHVQTNDNRVLTKGTAYLTDVGMTGYADGIIGMDKDPIINRFLSQMPQKFSVPSRGPARLNACIIDIDSKTQLARSIDTIRIDQDTSRIH